MSRTVVRTYTDYKSPYAFVAVAATYELEQDFDIALEWLPYTLQIAGYLGSVEDRSEHQWRRVRYSYMDARRSANQQGLTLKGPKKIYSAYYCSAGMLFAQKSGFFRPYNDTVFRKFWSHELDADSIDDIRSVIVSLGGDGAAFTAYAEGSGRDEHERIRTDAEAAGVFGVPMYVLDDGELFWGGDRLPQLRQRLHDRGLARKGTASDIRASVEPDRQGIARDETLVIYSMVGCPYAQRTRILLDLKRIPCEAVEIDLTKPRPDWFLTINPAGKVPALVHRGRALAESSVINEYIEDCFPDPPVFPADPYQRALSRNLVEFCNTRFTPNLYRLLMEQDESRRPGIRQAALDDWEWLEGFLARAGYSDGFLFGRFGIAELSFVPFFQRYWLNTYFWGFEVPPRLGRALRWQHACLSPASVAATSLSHDDYVKLYADYALGFANGKVPPGHERSALDLSVPLNERPMPDAFRSMGAGNSPLAAT